MKLARLIYKTSSSRILLAVLAVLFTLCVGPANSAPEPGTVTVVLTAEPQNIDPGDLRQDLTCHVLVKNILEPFLAMDPTDSKILPGLATSWKQVNPNTWQFSLRKGVKFHDGADFNAEAVLFSIKRIYDKRIPSRTRDKFFSGFKLEGKALDSHTLELKTDKVEPLLLTFLGFLPICSPSTPLDKLTRQPIGTGPYKFVKWDAGQQIVLERFDGYWGKQPPVKKGVFIWRRESAVASAMVAIGEADVALNIAGQDANRPDLDFSYLNTETSCINIGGEWEPPLNDIRVRMAMNYAVDRNAIRGSIMSKDSIPATQMIIPSISGYNPDLKVWPYDPQKARQLLDEARKDGVPVDKEILLVGRIGHYPGCEEVMEAVMTMHRAIGLNVKLKMFEIGVWQRYRTRPFPTNAGPYLRQGRSDNNFGDAAFSIFLDHHCKGGSSSMCDKTVDDLIAKAQVAMGEERKKLWQAAYKRIQEEIIPNILLFHMVGYSRVGKRINFKPSVATVTEIPFAQITFR